MEEQFLILFALMSKHAVADLALQSIRSTPTKRLWLNKGLHLHAMDHAILTTLVLLIWLNPVVALCYAILDYIAHWHIDFVKANILHKFNIVRYTNTFWNMQTLDQICHYATYIFIVYLIYSLA